MPKRILKNYIPSFGFSSSHVWMWEMDHKESWALKNWCFWTVVLEKTLESPLDCKEIKPVHPKGNQSWIFIRRIDAETEAPIFWPPDAKSWLIRKDPDAGKDRRQQEKGTTEDEMIGWHHWLNAHEFEQPPGDGEGEGSLACCSPWGRRQSDMAEWLNKNSPTELLWEVLKTFSATSESGCFNGTPLQYSYLENPMDGGAWWAAVHGVAKSRIRLSDFTFTFHFHALEKEMATHSSILAWRIPGTEEPSGLPSMGLHRVGHDWSDLAAT